MAGQVHAACAPGLVRRSLSHRITSSEDDTPHAPGSWLWFAVSAQSSN
jgi:hypothetical protein